MSHNLVWALVVSDLTDSIITENFTPEELERLQDPEFAKKFRHALEHDINVRL